MQVLRVVVAVVVVVLVVVVVNMKTDGLVIDCKCEVLLQFR